MHWTQRHGRVSKHLLVLSLFVPTTAVASLSPSSLRFIAPFYSYEPGLGPAFVAAGDLNEDSHPDLIVSNFYSGTVSVFLSRGDGTFSPRQDFQTGISPGPVGVGDLDRDGHLDLVVASQGTSYSISVLLGRGDGTFSSRVDYPVSGRSQAVGIGDFNEDGIPDLAIASGTASSISLFLGRGDGTFGTHLDVLTESPPNSVAVSDLNGDGHLDLIAATMGQRMLTVLLGKGDGTFLANADVSGQGGRGAVLVTGDFNGDRKADVVLESGDIYFFPGNGDGTLGSVDPIVSHGYTYTSLAAGDFNADGILDLVGTDPGTDFFAGPPPRGVVFVFTGRGDGHFSAPAQFFTGGGATSVAVADLNGDGRQDIATANFYGGSVSVVMGNGDGTFGGRGVLPIGKFVQSVAVGDFNLDGHPDIATANQTGTSSILIGKGDGTFLPSANLPVDAPSWAAAVGDVNRDGIPDLVVTSGSYPAAGSVSVRLGHGDGSFGPPQVFGTGAMPFWLAMGDLNGDRRTDIVTADWGFAGSLSLLLGDGTGDFRSRVQLLPGRFWAVAIGDLNGDGILDVVGEENSERPLSILLGRGDGTFAPGTPVPLGGFGFALAVADLNEDGNLDLVAPVDIVSPAHRAVLSVFWGQGDGTFPTRTHLSVAALPGYVSVGDIDNDGHPDMVTANGEAHTVSVYLGHGDGTFDPHVEFGVAGTTYSSAIEDFDGDGRPDIVAAGDSAVTVLLNRSDIVGEVKARAFLKAGDRAVPIVGGPAKLEILLEPVGGDFEVSNVDPSTIVMLSTGTGPVDRIQAVGMKTIQQGDADRNGVADVAATFAREDLGRLFGEIRGRHRITAALEGILRSGGRFRAELQMTVVGTGRPIDVAASVYPNPMNPRATLTFSTAMPGRVSVRLYDVRGRLARTVMPEQPMPAGTHRATIDGRDEQGAELPSGIYFYRIETPYGLTQGRVVVTK